jgi:hypothetical protein
VGDKQNFPDHSTNFVLGAEQRSDGKSRKQNSQHQACLSRCDGRLDRLVLQYSTRRLHHPLTPKREYLGSLLFPAANFPVTDRPLIINFTHITKIVKNNLFFSLDSLFERGRLCLFNHISELFLFIIHLTLHLRR